MGDYGGEGGGGGYHPGGAREPRPSFHLYVGGISYQATDGDIKSAFDMQGFSVKDVKLMYDRETGRSKGFCFINLEDANLCDAAISKMNGSEVSGRIVKVNTAAPGMARRPPPTRGPPPPYGDYEDRPYRGPPRDYPPHDDGYGPLAGGDGYGGRPPPRGPPPVADDRYGAPRGYDAPYDALPSGAPPYSRPPGYGGGGGDPYAYRGPPPYGDYGPPAGRGGSGYEYGDYGGYDRAPRGYDEAARDRGGRGGGYGGRGGGRGGYRDDGYSRAPYPRGGGYGGGEYSYDASPYEPAVGPGGYKGGAQGGYGGGQGGGAAAAGGYIGHDGAGDYAASEGYPREAPPAGSYGAERGGRGGGAPRATPYDRPPLRGPPPA
mmetsp:Transcript_56873/g.179934  ORF Transcript_56873/g.179934 Transcript_56873/m.179934 type:complete len:376 (-) Transcript_56873:567-1694(-)|eukprot:CAMPEP_0182859908 /NCGR_PEP_ID=MMETSP0034_2-20130328/4589_1 /TAXON_ID=156128 /ORGANISM="Nephroselmis pyriformis, Strain CCMP717" /LENGTH=375 /DNA_ID=CAMNT_0024991609 /DNA_START=135 /DNA_END=1262 /DNA_ORIENTATION=-